MIALKPDDGFKLFSTKENLSIALTRAKESLIFCGNFQYVCTDEYTEIDHMTNTWKTLVNDAKKRNRFFDLNGMFDREKINSAI